MNESGGTARSWGDRFNPVVVKEVRQAMRGGAFHALFLSFLALLVLITLVVALGENVTHDQQMAGRELFVWLIVALGGMLVIAVPLYAGIRMGTEMMTDQFNVFRMTGLSSVRIINGKFVSAMILNMLMVSAAVPLGFTCTLLRGIGLPTIFAVVVATTLFSSVAVLGTISAGCLVRSTVSAIGWCLFTLFGLCFVGMATAIVDFAIIDLGVLEFLGEGLGWLCCAAVPMVIVILFLYSAAVARLNGGRGLAMPGDTPPLKSEYQDYLDWRSTQEAGLRHARRQR